MSLSHALFSPAQASVLTYVFGQPARWFHVNELLRLTGLGSASLQRELARLDSGGLLLNERVGNLRRVRANASSPIYEALATLVRKTLGVVPILQDALRPLQDQFIFALVFGSVAKGTDTADSDIDVMVVGDGAGVSDILAALIPAEAVLGRQISPTCYTEAEFKTRLAQPDSFVNRVLSGPTLPLWGAASSLTT